MSQEHFLLEIGNPAIHLDSFSDFFKPYQKKLEQWPWECSVEQWLGYMLEFAQMPEAMGVFLDPKLQGGGSLKVRVDGAVISGVAFAEQEYHCFVTTICSRAFKQPISGQGQLEGFVRDEAGKLYLTRALETTLGLQITIYFPRQDVDQLSNWPHQAQAEFKKMQRHPNGLIVCCHRGWSQSLEDTIFAVFADFLESWEGKARIGWISEGLTILPQDETITQLRVDGSVQSWEMATRALVAQDVDVIVMRGRNETDVLAQAVLAALEDRLVIVDVSCISVLDTLMSLFNDLALSPHLVASVLLGVVGSYPGLRAVCPHCVRKERANESQRQVLAQHGNWSDDRMWPHIQGCSHCYGVGYALRDRKSVAEAIYVDAELADFCSFRPSREELKQMLLTRGFRTYFDQALELAQQGVTTLHEAIRVGLARKAEL